MGSYSTDDPRVREVLDRRPVAGGHGTGQGVPGVAEFPADWAQETVLERITAVTGEPHHSLVAGTSTASFREFDGVWIGTVVRLRNGAQQLVTAFPVVDGKRILANPSDGTNYLLNRTAEEVLKQVREQCGDTDEGRDLVWAGSALLKAGEPYEAAIWLVEVCSLMGIVLPESLYSNLLLMADDGYFDDSYGPEFRKIIASQWRAAHPGTWARG